MAAIPRVPLFRDAFLLGKFQAGGGYFIEAHRYLGRAVIYYRYCDSNDTGVLKANRLWFHRLVLTPPVNYRCACLSMQQQTAAESSVKNMANHIRAQILGGTEA